MITHHLPPTNVIRLIHSYNRRKFAHIFGANKTKLKSFWSGLFRTNEGKHFKALHPILKDKGLEELQTYIPIIVHEDAAPYGKKRSVNVVQWGPLEVHGSDMESRFVHHCYIHKKGDPAETARTGWELLWDEFDHMAEGRDSGGEYIAKDTDGTIWKFVFTFSENDFDMDKEHGLPNCGMGVLFCRHCKATNRKNAGMNTRPMSDLTPTAKWRQTIITNNDIVKNRTVRPHPLTDSRYFNMYTCRSDTMHCNDHHGVWNSIIGSVLCYLITNDGEPSLGTSKDRRLQTINKLLKDFYKENIGAITSKVDTLTMSNIQQAATAYATLSGPTIMAANTRSNS